MHFYRPFPLATYFVLVLFSALSARAEQAAQGLADAPLRELPQEIERAKEQFTPTSEEEAARRRRDVLSALGRLERYLSRADATTQANWKAYLMWEDLRREIAKETGSDLVVLREVRERLLRPETGLELRPFRDLEASLTAYISAVYTRTDPRVAETYRQVLDALKQQVEQYLTAPSTEATAPMGQYLDFLLQTEQAPRVTAALRRYFGHPNLHISASGEAISAATARDVDEPAEVNEVILGTRIRGSGRTRGRAFMTLQPSDDRATLVLNLVAQANTHNIGVNGPVTIYSTGATDIRAWHTIYITDLGITAGEAFAQACVKSNIYCIAAKLRIIEAIAWRQARESTPEAEAISSARAGMRAREQLTEQVRDQLREPNEKFQENIRRPLERRRLIPELMRFSTTSERLYGVIRHATERQLASPTPAPADVGGDASVRIHESGVANLAESVAGGYTLGPEDFDGLSTVFPAQENGPPEFEDDRIWTITLRQERPFTALFRDGKVTLRVSLSEFMTEDQVLEFPLDATAVYRIESSPEGPKLVREGDVEITWPVRRPTPFLRRTALESKFRIRFGAVFREELLARDIRLEDAPEGFRALRDFVIRSEDGWLTIGLRRVSAN